MAIRINSKGNRNAKSLISSGKLDKDSSWSITPEEEDAILGNGDWAEYGKWFLGVDDAEADDTKGHFKFPMGKGGKIYRAALIAIRQRTGQQDDTGIFEAAGKLIDLIDDDGKENDNDGDEKAGMFDTRRINASSVPWALMPECIAAIVNPYAISERVARTASRPAAPTGSIAVISLSGVITQHPDWMGDTNLDDFTSDLMSAANDPSVGSILLSIDSPGGSVYGIQEVAAMISAVGKSKPVVAFANSLAASAAYWLGCAASEFYCTPSGEVGSIGVWQAHMDISQMMADAGVKTTIISAGKYKVEGNPYEPLDEDAQAFMQSRIDDYYAAFCSAVAKSRGVSVSDVQSGMGQGRVLGADAAVKAGMIDGVMTAGQVISMMQSRSTNVKPSARKAELSRSSLALI